MSLNGLDAIKVNEVHESAIAENGGWFLLHYTSRDEVDVLQAGTGGCAEVRETIAKYEEKSPLYGLLVYRRKKVLLKYVPDGTSRLLQARLVVHVQSVIEKFPHDALIDVETASDVNETTLSSSVSAPRTSASTISNESRKSRRRLTEIAEDVGETLVQDSQAATTNPEAQSDVKEADHVRRPSAAVSNDSDIKQEEAAEEKLEAETIQKLDSTSHIPDGEQLPRGLDPNLIIASRKVDDTELKVATLASSEALAYLYKPKIKLAPRPSLESRHSSPFVRPVSTLPTGVRLGQRDHDTMRRPQTQQAHSKPFFALPNVRPHGSSASAYNAPVSDRPPSRAGSAATVPANPRHVEQPNAVTPEKQRLMKALQKRKKNQLAKGHKGEPAKPTMTSSSIDKSRSESIGSDLEKSAVKTVVEKEPLDASIKSVSSDSPSSSPSKTNEQKEKSGEVLRSIDESTTKEDSVASLPSGNATDHQIKVVKADSMPSQATPTTSVYPHTILETGKQAPSETPSPQVQAFDTNTSTVQAPHQAVPSPPQPKPEDILLPPEDNEETTTFLLHPDERPDEATTNLPSHSPTEQAQASTQTLTEDTCPAAASVQHVLEYPADKKQKPKPPPIIPVRQEDSSRAPSLSEESLLEELQSATVEEAKSISLSKSPPTPFSPNSPRRIDMRRSSEGARRPARLDSEAPPTPTIESSLAGSLSRLHSDTDVVAARKEQTPPRSSPSPLQLRNGAQTPGPVTALPKRSDSLSPTLNDTADGERPSSKKSGVSSLISQRIKAFENFSTSTSPSHPPKTVVTPAIVTLRKASLNTPPTSASAEPGRNSNYFSSQVGYPTPSPSPHGFSARLFKSRKTSVTDLRSKGPELTRPKVAKSLSAGSVDSQSAVSDHPISPPPPLNKRSSFFAPRSPRTKSSSTSSIASSKDVATATKADAPTNRLSNSSRRSSSETQGPPRSLSSESITSDGEKKESKKKRFLKRLSSIGAAPRRTIAQALSPTLNSQPILESQEPEPAKKWSAAVTVGDVNVQFPDTLLWKRRHLEVDDHGYLVLSQVDKGSKVGTKRFHVSDFRTPYVPDPDREELPHSVALDFHDSSTLQCACESAMSQMHVLQVLLKAHGAFSRES